MPTCLLVFLFSGFIAVVLSDETAKLRYFYSSIDDYTELPLEGAHEIFKLSWYNSSRPTVIFAHGFTGYPQGPAVTAVINSYLAKGGRNVVLLNWQEWAASTYPNLVTSYVNWAAPNARKNWGPGRNVVLLNWQERAASNYANFVTLYVKWAAPTARKLGSIFAETLFNMSEAGLDLNKTELVGHSLGAQMFGIAGNALLLKGVLLPWIIGLDPAGVGFEGRPANSRLNPNSAGFVCAIHSDPNKYGIRRPVGTVDFWPNFRVAGAVMQPGCGARGPMFSTEDLCNHNRSWQLLIDAIKYPGSVLGSYAKNYRKWKNSSKREREAVVLELGVYDKDAVPGDYFFTTAAQSPYGLGKVGL